MKKIMIPLVFTLIFSCSGEDYNEVSLIRDLLSQENYSGITRTLKKHKFIYRNSDGKGEVIYDGELSLRKTAAIIETADDTLALSLVIYSRNSELINDIKGTLKRKMKSETFSERYFEGEVSDITARFSNRDDFYIYVELDYPLPD